MMVKEIISIKYRIYPTKEQASLINETFGCCVKYWNLALDDSIKSYKENGKSIFYTQAHYKDEYPFLRNVDSIALANVYLNLRFAYRLFFDKKAKFPKFKSIKSERKSYTTNNINNTIRIENSKIRLPKVGFVKLSLYRLPEIGWELRNVNVSQDKDGKYYASVTFKYEVEKPNYTIDINKSIGLDYKSDGLYIDSNGNVGSNHKYFKESQKKLSKAQRKLNRTKRNSKNHEKQRKKVARIYKHTANQRKDNLHKLSHKLVNEYDIICVESLNLVSISKRKKIRIGKTTMDNGFGMFVDFLNYKAKRLGKQIIKIDKFYPSTKTCSCCGHIHDMKLNDRVYYCPKCGLQIDRDLNAAINIKTEGLRMFIQKTL